MLVDQTSAAYRRSAENTVAAGGDLNAGVVLLEALACFQAGQIAHGMSYLRQLQQSSGLAGLATVLCPDLHRRRDHQARRIRRLIDHEKPAAGSPGVSDSGTQSTMTPFEDDYYGSITEKQAAVLACVQKGMTNIEIARHIGVSKNTVKWHLKEAFVRLGANNRCSALHIAVTQKLI